MPPWHSGIQSLACPAHTRGGVTSPAPPVLMPPTELTPPCALPPLVGLPPVVLPPVPGAPALSAPAPPVELPPVDPQAARNTQDKTSPMHALVQPMVKDVALASGSGPGKGRFSLGLG